MSELKLLLETVYPKVLTIRQKIGQESIISNDIDELILLIEKALSICENQPNPDLAKILTLIKDAAYICHLIHDIYSK